MKDLAGLLQDAFAEDANDFVAGKPQQNLCFRTRRFNCDDLGCMPGRVEQEMFRTDAELHLPSLKFCYRKWQGNAGTVIADEAAAADFATDDVHCRGADEACNEEICRVIVELERRSHLLNDPT